MYSKIADKASKNIIRIVNNYYFDARFMPFKITYKKYLVSNPVKIDLLFYFEVRGTASIASIVVSFNILNGSYKIEGVESKHGQIAVLDNNTKRKFLLNERMIKCIFSEAFEKASDGGNYSSIKKDFEAESSKLHHHTLKKKYELYKNRNVSTTVYSKNSIVGHHSNNFVLNLDIDTHILTLTKRVQVLKQIRMSPLSNDLFNVYEEPTEETSVEIRIDYQELKKYFIYYTNTNQWLASPVLLFAMKEKFSSIEPVLGNYDLAHRLNKGMIYLFEQMVKKTNFFEIWTDFPTIENKKSSNSDLILEKLEYAIGLNPSSHIKDELDKMKSDYIAEKEAEIKRKEQEKRDTEAERILITLKNYYVRGEFIEEERIN